MARDECPHSGVARYIPIFLCDVFHPSGITALLDFSFGTAEKSVSKWNTGRYFVQFSQCLFPSGGLVCAFRSWEKVRDYFVKLIAALAARMNALAVSTTYSFSYQRKGQSLFSSGKSG